MNHTIDWYGNAEGIFFKENATGKGCATVLNLNLQVTITQPLFKIDQLF